MCSRAAPLPLSGNERERAYLEQPFSRERILDCGLENEIRRIRNVPDSEAATLVAGRWRACQLELWQSTRKVKLPA